MTRTSGISLLVCGLLWVTAAPSSADTITFDNSSLNSGAMGPTTVSLSGGAIDAVSRTLMTIGFNTTGACGVGGIYGCLSITTGTFEGPDLGTPEANDYPDLGLNLGSESGTAVLDGIPLTAIPNGATLSSGSFGPNTNLSLAFNFNDVCHISPTECTGDLTPTLAMSTLNTELPTAFDVTPTTLDGNDIGLFNASPALMTIPAGDLFTGPNITEALVNPEPGTLILLGSGLFFAARFARRRQRAI